MVRGMEAKWCHCTIENRRVRSTWYASGPAETRPIAEGGVPERSDPCASRHALPGSNPALPARLMAAGKRHECHGQKLPRSDTAIAIDLDEHQMLEGEWTADRNHHSAARPELLDQRRRNLARRGGDDDAGEGGRFLPAVIPGALARRDICIAQAF